MYQMKITKYCTLKWFQICINHNILITNIRPQYTGIKDDSLCTFCKTHVETSVHLLWDCSIAKKKKKKKKKSFYIMAAKFPYSYRTD